MFRVVSLIGHVPKSEFFSQQDMFGKTQSQVSVVCSGSLVAIGMKANGNFAVLFLNVGIGSTKVNGEDMKMTIIFTCQMKNPIYKVFLIQRVGPLCIRISEYRLWCR